MARISEGALLQEENEAAALGFFEQAFEALKDPRRPQGVRYPLRTVVVTALMAMVCGCDDAEAMEAWGEANAEWLSGFLSMPHGPPSQDVFLNVFGALDPSQFSRVFESWAQLVSLRLLHRRFPSGPVAPYEDRVRAADIERLDRWTDQVLAAETVEDIFR